MKTLLALLIFAATLAAQTVSIGASVFTGTGLNDATSGGRWTSATTNATFTVIVTATGTFKWQKNAGSFTTGVAMTGGSVPQTLSDGVTVAFAAASGHTATDQWVITATAQGSLAAVNTIQAGAGAVVRTAEAKARDWVSVKDYGAKGDATADDTAAVQAAITTGYSIDWPCGTYKISTRLSMTSQYQSMRGHGSCSVVIQTGTGVDSTAFYLNGGLHNEFRDMYIFPGTTTSHVVDGWAIFVSSSSHVLIDGVEVASHRRGAFAFYNSNNNIVTNFFIHDSVVDNSATTHETANDTGNDVYFYGSSSRNTASHGRIVNGSGVGCVTQTAGTGSDVADDNTCDDIDIDGEPLYGMMAYRAAGTDSVQRMHFLNNHISNISGNIPQAPTITGVVSSNIAGTAITLTSGTNFASISVGTVIQINYTSQTVSVKTDSTHVTVTPGVGGALSGLVWSDALHTYGTGIYIASGESPVIVNNTIRNVNVYQPTQALQAPGCVGVSGIANVTVDNIDCWNPGSYSFSDLLSTASTAGASRWSHLKSHAAVANICFRTYDIPNLTIDGLYCYNSASPGGVGVLDEQIFNTQSDVHSFTHLDIENYGAGMTQSGTINNTSLTDGYVSGNTGYAALVTATQAKVSGMTVNQGTGGVGLGFNANVTSGQMRNNYIRGGSICIVNDAGPTFLLDQNDTGNHSDAGVCSTSYSGGGGVEFVLENSATPTVAGGARDFKITDATTRTDFLHGTPGQEIHLRASLGVTIQNTATIQLATSHDFVMAANDYLSLKFITSSWVETSRTVAASASFGISGTFTVRNAAGTGTCTFTTVNGFVTASTC